MSVEILTARKHIRALIDDSSPVDSPTAYYALFHPIDRSALFTAHTVTGEVAGFAGRFQTGADLFRPLVTLKCVQVAVAADLLNQTLIVGRPYILFANLNQLPMVGGSMQIENQRILRIFTVDPSRFKPVINIMVERYSGPDGLPRCLVKSEDKTLAAAGTNWKSPGFAEIYVQTEPQARQRGWGRSVVSSLTAWLLQDGIRPIYLVENDNTASRDLIESLGYFDTGSRQVYADVIYTGHPVRSPNHS